MLRKIIVLLFVVFSFLSISLSASAQESSFNTVPSLEKINDFTPDVTVTFNDPEIEQSNNDKFVCLEQDLCIDDKDIRNGVFEGNLENIASATRGLDEDQVDEKAIELFKLGENNEIVVCGNGSDRLKAATDYANGTAAYLRIDGCDKDNDYFHSGSVYLLSVYEKAGDQYILRSVAGFYINHGLPKVEIKPTFNLEPQGRFEITLSSDELRAGGDDRNNYKILVSGPGIDNGNIVPNTLENKIKIGDGEQCVELSSAGNSKSATLPRNDGLTFGQYTIKIQEQVNEKNKCTGGFTYYEMKCTVAADLSLSNCGELVEDPDNGDFTTMAKLFVKLGLSGGGNKLPCSLPSDDPLSGFALRAGSVDKPLDCDFMETALGTVSLNLDELIVDTFNLILSIAGAAAVILIIYGGYDYMTSRGDPERVKHAREIITAAIIGLLFIIFSFVMLQVIAGDILRIPGFEESPPIAAPDIDGTKSDTRPDSI